MGWRRWASGKVIVTWPTCFSKMPNGKKTKREDQVNLVKRGKGREKYKGKGKYVHVYVLREGI
jgi:hypothetical protein